MPNRDDPANASAYVDAGILAHFVPPTATQTQSDVLDSILLAQLAADKMFSRIGRPRDWYSAYTTTLDKIAWNVATLEFGIYYPTADQFTLAEVLTHISHRATPALLRETLASFAALPEDDPRSVVYGEFAVSEHAVSVLAGVATGASISVVGVCLRTTQSIERPFDTEFLVESLEGRVETVFCRTVLNEELYAKIRGQVVDKLGPKRDELILILDNEIPPTGERK